MADIQINLVYTFVLLIIVIFVGTIILTNLFGLDIVLSSGDAKDILTGDQYLFSIKDAKISCESDRYDVELRELGINKISGGKKPIDIIVLLDTSTAVDMCKFETGELCVVNAETSELREVGFFSASGSLPKLTFWQKKDNIINYLNQNKDATFSVLAETNREFYLGSAEFSINQIGRCIPCTSFGTEQVCNSADHCRWQESCIDVASQPEEQGGES